jgi:hypothetical protein
MELRLKNLFFTSLLILVFSSGIASGEEQPPLSAMIVQSDPYYFSEGDLGLKILKFFEVPLTPYLIPGKTTEESSLQEISDVYADHTKNLEQKSIVDDANRATVFVVKFSNGDLKEPHQFDTFQKFTHIDDIHNMPYYYQNIRYGLELESLPSQDKKPFYDDLVIPSINSDKKPEPFDVTVSMMTGNGNTIQEWKYKECTIVSYTPYLDENLFKLKFVGDLVSEIRDKTAFRCDGFGQDFVKKEPLKKPESTLIPVVPSKENRAERIIVEFSDGELKTTNTFYSFSKFLPITKDPSSTIPISIPGNVIGQKPMFSLESLPTKDKERYYEFVGRYVNPGPIPQPFDTTIHIVTGNGKILQSWKYADCSTSNYVTFFTDNLIRHKFKQIPGSEIREKTFFECRGLSLDSTNSKIDTKQTHILNDSERAQTFVVHFQGPEISPERTITSFTKFSPITHEELQFLLPNSPFGKQPKFYLESLPSKENQWYYDLMSRYINAGKIPDPFDVTLGVLTGDGTQIQSWKYTDCQVLEYKTYLEDSRFLGKFTNKLEKEFRDRTVFQCVGFVFDGMSKPPQQNLEKQLDYVDFIPSDQSRITRLSTTFSGGDLTEPFIIDTIGKFTPKIEQRHQTQAQLIKLSTAVIQNETPNSSVTNYDQPPTCAPGESPPGCTPCPSNNPHCSEDGGDGGDGGEIPSNPEEPGINTPSFTVLVTTPHLSITQKNDYVKSTEFTIKSLPSKDKSQYYEIISQYINAGKKPEPFDVTFDYLSGDNTIIQSWNYFDCELKDFKIKRDDVILYFPLGDMLGVADIVDASTFRCNGFAVDFSQRKSNLQSNNTIPSQYDRAMLNLAHWYGGELQNQRSSALLQEFATLDNSDVVFGGLPNIHHKDIYQFVGRYVNPGKSPEPIDMRFDTVTGDGTVLYSTLYHDCTVKDSSVYLSDNMGIIKYIPGLKSEIRGKAVSDCVGITFKTYPQNDSRFDHSGNLKKISVNTQRAIGVPSEGIICNDGYALMIRPPNNVPICVKDDHVENFEKHGWKYPNLKEKKNLIDVLRSILPTNNERAMSFVVEFEGTDISPAKTITTFSKFFPTENVNSLIQKPSNALDSSAKSFYLESLPNNDNSWYYDLASRYVNAGAKPEPFNVTIQIKSGAGDDLQIWEYRECEITEYLSYYDENLLTYKFHGKWQAEIKDKSVFSCSGLSIA